MSSELKCEFLVLGFECPDSEITQQIGIEPTMVINQGDIKRRDPEGVGPDILEDQSVWCLKSELGLDASAEEHIDFMLKKLSSVKDKIIRLGGEYELEISVYGYVNYSQVGVNIASQVMKEFATYNMALDIDIYALEDEE